MENHYGFVEKDIPELTELSLHYRVRFRKFKRYEPDLNTSISAEILLEDGNYKKRTKNQNATKLFFPNCTFANPGMSTEAQAMHLIRLMSPPEDSISPEHYKKVLSVVLKLYDLAKNIKFDS